MEENILNGVDVVRAWKDADYRSSLTSEQRDALPPTPANLDELSDEELEEVAGGVVVTYKCPVQN